MDATLGEILRSRDYALCLSPGFFRFYAHTGVLQGLHRHGALRATHLSGSSAGAMVAGFYAAGLSPDQMVDAVLTVKRDDFWDLGGFGGLLRGSLFHQILDNYLPKKKFEDCEIPCAVTAFDCMRFKTTHISDGCIATAIRASCTFPGLFQPVIVNSTPHIDGGVFDDIGLMALPGVPESNFIVNVIFEGSRHEYSKLPVKYHGAELLTIIVKDVPMVSPFSMSEAGPVALSSAFKATLYALQTVRPTKLAERHWFAVIAQPPVDFRVEVILNENEQKETLQSKRKTSTSVIETYGAPNHEVSSTKRKASAARAARSPRSGQKKVAGVKAGAVLVPRRSKRLGS